MSKSKKSPLPTIEERYFTDKEYLQKFLTSLLPVDVDLGVEQLIDGKGNNLIHRLVLGDQGAFIFKTAIGIPAEVKICDLIKSLTEKGFNIDHKNKEGFTPLHMALIGLDSHSGQSKTTKILEIIECGADVDCKFPGPENITPLEFVLSNGYPEIALEILKKSKVALSDEKISSLKVYCESLPLEMLSLEYKRVIYDTVFTGIKSTQPTPCTSPTQPFAGAAAGAEAGGGMGHGLS